MKIIAYGYKSRRGKNLAADFTCEILKEKYPTANIVNKSFAYALKRICYDLFSYAGLKPPEYYELYPHEKIIILDEIKKTPVDIWIDFSEIFCKKIDQDIWSKHLLYGVQECDFLVIPDLRFPREIERLRKYQSTIVRVDRDIQDLQRMDSNLDTYTGWDYIINNNKDISHLRYHVGKVVDLCTK